MKADDEFQVTGKKVPFKVPDGFFDHITQKTLDEAKLRGISRKRRIIAWSSLAAAASVAAVVIVSIVIFPLSPGKKVPQYGRNITLMPETDIPDHQLTVKENGNDQILSEPVEKNTGDDLTAENENLETILAALSDEDLLQLAAGLKSDTFIEETNEE